MSDVCPGLVLPKGLDDIDAAFMTRVLRHSGVIAATNEVVVQEEKDVGMTAGWQGSALKNELPVQVELGGQGATETDLSLEERRQQMWWGKTCTNFRENFKIFNQDAYLQGLPENLEGLGPWVELPEHLQ